MLVAHIVTLFLAYKAIRYTNQLPKMPSMRNILLATLAVAFAGVVNAAPLVSRSQPMHWAVTRDNTVNSTGSANSTIIPGNTTTPYNVTGGFIPTTNTTINSTATHNFALAVAQDSPSSPLVLSFTNNFDTSSQINAYLTGLDGDGAAYFLLANSTAYYPPNPPSGQPPTEITEDIAIPLGAQGSTFTVNLPNYMTSGRIYFSVDTITFYVNYGKDGPAVVAPSFTNSADPNIDTNYGFVEFTWVEDGGVYSNLSYVDFVGLPISQVVTDATQGTCTVIGLPGNAVSTICSALAAQEAEDGQAWSTSCQTDSSGTPIRVLTPLHLIEIDSSALQNYYTDYINDVWTYYETNTLTISDDATGTYTGTVDTSTGLMTFNSGNTYAKPVITDILGCNSGPFANPGSDAAGGVIVPRFCAAFVRTTLLLSGGNLQPDGVPESEYYSVSPTDHYSRIVHATEVDGKGYAFSYDDVTPSGGATADGLCNAPEPVGITFTVGGTDAT